MKTSELYMKTIRPLSADERLNIARLILEDLAPDHMNDFRQSETGFDYLKRLLPQIERITLSDQDLASVTLDKPQRQ
jgi:hypothetical protein